MRNTPYDGYLGPSLPKEVQKKRLEQVLRHELTPLQRETVIAYYVLQKKHPHYCQRAGREQIHRVPDPSTGRGPAAPLPALLEHWGTTEPLWGQPTGALFPFPDVNGLLTEEKSEKREI